MVDPPQQGAGGDVAEENIGTNGNAHPSPVNREVLVHTFQGQLNNMLIDQVRMQRQLRDVMRTMQDWSQEHERIVQLLRRSKKLWTQRLRQECHYTVCVYLKVLSRTSNRCTKQTWSSSNFLLSRNSD